MTTALETAFPSDANWVRDTVVAKLAEAFIPVFATATLAAEDFSTQPYRAIAVGGPDGDLEFYAYDSTDTTTVDDGGVSCIVVSGRRYKKRIDVIIRDSAKSATTDAQPVSPSLGDTYVLTAAPSGDDWASEAKAVATYTARGWIFRDPFVGMTVYVEDEDSFYHYDSNGDWVAGLGPGAIADGSITPLKLAHPFAILKVVDQRNSPPGGTPTDGTMYQVGTSATDDFASHENDIARWNTAGSGAWEFIEPEEGDTIYRLDEDALYSFRSGAWVLNVPLSVVVQSHYVDDVTVATSATGITNRLSSPSITAEVGQKIRVTGVILSWTASGAAGTRNFGIRIDTAGSFAKNAYSSGNSLGQGIPFFCEIDVPDANAHVYHIATTSSTNPISDVTCRAVFDVIQPS